MHCIHRSTIVQATPPKIGKNFDDLFVVTGMYSFAVLTERDPGRPMVEKIIMAEHNAFFSSGIRNHLVFSRWIRNFYLDPKSIFYIVTYSCDFYPTKTFMGRMG